MERLANPILQQHGAVCCAAVQIERYSGALLEKRLPRRPVCIGCEYVELRLKGQVRPQWDGDCPCFWSNSTTGVQGWTPGGRVTKQVRCKVNAHEVFPPLFDLPSLRAVSLAHKSSIDRSDPFSE